MRLYVAVSNFEEQLSAFRIEPVNQLVIDEAFQLVKKFGKTSGLRALDAIHLATFNIIAEDSWYFVAADNNLCTVARAAGGAVLNPLIPDGWQI